MPPTACAAAASARRFLLAGTFALSLAAQFALVFDWPVPAIVSWSLIATAGVATVLGYTVLGEIFPKHASGRANGALNLLQVAAAFAVQSVFGGIVSLWEPNAGSYPPEAYRTALVFFIVLQLVAFGWFATAGKQATVKRHNEHQHHATTPDVEQLSRSEAYRAAAMRWALQMRQARNQISIWRSAAAASFMLLAVLGSSVGSTLLSNGLRGDRSPARSLVPPVSIDGAIARAQNSGVTIIRAPPHHASGDLLLRSGHTFRERLSHASLD